MARNLHLIPAMQVTPTPIDPLFGLFPLGGQPPSPAAPEAPEWLELWNDEATRSAIAQTVPANTGGLPPMTATVAPAVLTEPQSQRAIATNGEAVQAEPLPAQPLATPFEEEQPEPLEPEANDAPAVPIVLVVPPTVPARPVEPAPVAANGAGDEPAVRETRAESPANEPATIEAATGALRDKGELIWTAELLLDPAAPAESGVRETEVFESASIPTPKGPSDRQRHESAGQQDNRSNAEREHQPDAPPARRPVHTAAKAEREASAPERPVREPAEPKAPGMRTVERAATMTPEGLSVPSVPDPGPRYASAVEEPRAPQPIQAIESVEPTTPPRPQQVTTVQVDLGEPGVTTSGEPSLRLVVTQRGENVNVALRSWDDSVAPIPAGQMRPLLENLASNGLRERHSESAWEPLGAAAASESPSSKALTAAESSESRNESQNPGHFDDRQERRQEQQRQHQQLFQRRPPANRIPFRLSNQSNESR